MADNSYLEPKTGIYEELRKDSLRATSMENGLQYSAIYWETGHRTWLPFWASFTQKFTWKLIDDKIRQYFGFIKPITTEPFIFSHTSIPYIRQYFGDPDIHMPVALGKKIHFAFRPTGNKTFIHRDNQSKAMAGVSDIDRENLVQNIIKSAVEA